MKMFAKLVKEYTAESGRIKYKQFLDHLRNTHYFELFEKVHGAFPDLPIRAKVHIMMHGRPVCQHPDCSNYTNWSFRFKSLGFNRYCSPKCQNSDPAKIMIQTATKTKSHAQLIKGLSDMREVYKDKPVTELSEKHIEQFNQLLPKGIKEYEYVHTFSEELKYIWFNLPYKHTIGKRLMALGKVPLVSYCQQCGKPVNIIKTTIEQWAMYCSVYCANKANQPIRLSDKAVAKMTQTLRLKSQVDPEYCKRMYGTLMQGIKQKYGEHIQNISQVPSIAHKISLSLSKGKEFQLGSRLVTIQGYEGKALSILLTTYSADDLAVFSEGTVPSIKYKRVQGGIGVHHPDMFIRKENRLVEVKSVYTLIMNERGWDNLRRKRNAAVKQGFLYSLLVPTNKLGSLIRLPRTWYLFSYKKMCDWLTKYNKTKIVTFSVYS